MVLAKEIIQQENIHIGEAISKAARTEEGQELYRTIRDPRSLYAPPSELPVRKSETVAREAQAIAKAERVLKLVEAGIRELEGIAKEEGITVPVQKVVPIRKAMTFNEIRELRKRDSDLPPAA
jgi:hypothetical protein